MKRSANFEQRDYGQRWTHKGNKFVIGTLHGTTLEITAQYNPKELSRQASAQWTPHPNTSAKQSPSADTHLWMEYGTTAPRTLTLELLFDGYEEGISIAKVVEDLESLTMPVNMASRIASERRPQACVAVWGSQALRCVVTSVSTHLTMFDATGEPLRAICSVTLQEVDVAAMMQADKGNSDFVSRQDQIKAHSTKHATRRHWTDDKPVVDAWKSAQVQRGKPATPPKQTATIAPVEAEDEQDRDDDRREEQMPAPMTAPASAPAPASASASASATPDNIGSAPPSNTVGTPSDIDSPRAAASPASQATPASTTVGTPSSKFAGDDDLDSPRAAAPPAKTIGTPSSRFAGDSDLDSPRASAPPAKKPSEPTTVGTPSTKFAGDDDLDSPRTPINDDLE